VNQFAQTNNPTLELYELLLQNRSIFGRLVHIAGLWNPETKSYERGLPERFRSATVDRAISSWHQAFFMEWVALSLTQQQNDVAIHWSALGRTAEQLKIIREQGEAAIPPLVEWAERRSFLQNLGFIHTLLSHEVKVDSTAA
jgi:hypothetical protein